MDRISELLKEFFPQASLPLILYDDSGRFEQANTAAADIFDLHDLPETTSLNLFDNPHLTEERREELMSTGRTAFRASVDFDAIRRLGYYSPRRSGSIPFDWNISRVEGTGYVVMLRDVTEEVRSKEAFAECEAFYASLVENSTSSIMVVQDGKYIFANPAGCEMLGYAGPEEMRGLAVHDTMVSTSHALIKERLIRTPDMGKAPSLELDFVKKDGTTLVCRCTTAAITYRGMPAVLIIGDDVSEYRRMQLSLTESLEEKELLFRELNHRTKNNLFLIQSLISIEQGRAVSQETGEVLDRLYGRIGSVMSLHEQLSVEGAGLSVGLKKYLNDIVGAFRETSLNDAVDIRFSTEIDDLRADAKTSTSIGLVLTEFVTNALKHAFRDSSSGAIAVKMIRTERQVVLEVRDDGDGFDPKSLVQKDDSLGISLVRVLSRDLGGELSFGSEPGKGSWFKLLFTDEALAAFYS